jgi:cytochrome c
MAAVAEAAGCLGCHAVSSRLVGPSYAEVADRYKGQDAAAKLVAKVRAGGEGGWGAVAMPPQTDIKDEDLKALVAWILEGAPNK